MSNRQHTMAQVELQSGKFFDLRLPGTSPGTQRAPSTPFDPRAGNRKSLIGTDAPR
jgi:hypothetical protein